MARLLDHVGGSWVCSTALFVSGHYLGTGIGGMERLAAYPLPIWTIVMGLALGRHPGPLGRNS